MLFCSRLTSLDEVVVIADKTTTSMQAFFGPVWFQAPKILAPKNFMQPSKTS